VVGNSYLGITSGLLVNQEALGFAHKREILILVISWIMRIPSTSSLVLHIAPLVVAVLVAPLSGMGDPRSVYKYLDLLFYVGAYLAVSLTPNKWAALQTGFCAGYAISMCPAIFLITVAGAVGFPSGSVPPTWLFVSAIISNLILAIVALTAWYFRRGEVNHLWVKWSLGVGLVYPFVAFFAVAALAVPFTG
jgi:hypothetical protein